MPYEVKFAEAVEKALASEDVAKAVAQSSRVDIDYVRQQLRQDEVEVLGLIAPLLQTYADIERSVVEIEDEHEKILNAPGPAETLILLSAYLFFAVIVFGISWLAGAAYPGNFLRATASGWTWQRWLVTAIGTGLAITGIMAVGSRTRRPAIIAKIATDPRLPSRKKELVSQRDRIDGQVEELVLANAFELLGQFRPPFFQARLVQEGDLPPAGSKRIKVTSPRGLSEVVDQAHETPTEARREILELLNRLPGASIGLSGPRGAGKTTILRSLTAANLPLRGKTGIAIYTAAPVEYDARDFLLHLFATLCRQVLKTYDSSEDETNDGAGANGPGDPAWADRLAPLAPLLVWVGFSFSVVALGLALAIESWAKDSGASSAFLKTLELKPGSLLLFGLSTFLTGLALKLYSSSLALPLPILRLIRSLFAPTWNRGDPPPEPEPELVRNTRRQLRDIRFQRSFTSGWSGAIKVPALDISETRSTALAQRQESLPELVDRFNSYVRKVAAEHGAVIIAVDELDKLKGAEEAEQFINSVKSIFAIPNCFYLISVSEDALSAFERRGLSLRDAFDSAFDDIRYIGYKQLPEARQMLLRRVLNLPDPFLCLCHILSGGLPRDLIRIARAMFQSASQSGPAASLTNVARALVKQEAAAKIRASRTAMRSIALEPEAGAFASALAALEERQLNRRAYRKMLDSLVAAPRPDADPVAFAKLSSIQRELKAYLEFLLVTLELSTLLATRQGWRMASERLVERLARARQSLESSVSVGTLQVQAVQDAIAKAEVARAP